jgi:PBP1b-binding outer membrane lipoprotein LpoB
MKSHQKPDHRLVCIALLIILATFMVAGCMESATEQQVQPAATNEKQNENPAVKAVTAPMTITAQPSPAPDPSLPFITVDPISDKNIGDLVVISGTTNLPDKTAIYLYRTLENTGEEKMTANKQVLSGTNGINRWRFAFDSSGFRPGSYTVTVATGKKAVSGFAQFTLAGTFLGTDNPTYYSGSSKASGSAGAPTITVQPVGNRQQGDVFLISGTTSLPQGTLLMYQVYPDYFEDKTKRSASSSPVPSGIAGDSIVIRGDGNTNKWFCALDTEGYEKTTYIVNVSTVNEDYTIREIFGRTQFTLR